MPRPTANALRGPEFKGLGAIYLQFPYSEEAVKTVRQYPQAKWVKQLKCWVLPQNRSAAVMIMKLFPNAETNEAFRNLLPQEETSGKTERNP